MRSRAGQRYRPNGFTLVELLVVVSIIGILIAVLLPMASKVRTAARNTATTNTISQIGQAITTYHTDFGKYPGPLAYDEIHNSNATASPWPTSGAPRFPGFELPAASVSGFVTISGGEAESASQIAPKITDSENLVLGLMGGLRVNPTNGNLQYDPSLVGNGPTSLSQTSVGKKSSAYITSLNMLSFRDTADGKTGHFKDDSGAADDTIIPEFVDNYSSPMPILYLRARIGVTPHAETVPPATVLPRYNDNSIVTFDSSGSADPRVGTFDLEQIISYTGMHTGNWPTQTLVADPTMGGGTTIGEGKSLKTMFKNSMSSSPVAPFHGISSNPDYTRNLDSHSTTGYDYPYNAYPYFKNASQGSQAVPVPQQKDGYILISAGPDRVYGTSDDITNFGVVGQ